MKNTILLSLLALGIATGCNEATQAPVDYANGLAKAKQNAGKTVDTTSLNQAISMFQVDKGRFPKDLDELVQEKYLTKIPEPPYGMKIDYDATTGKATVVNQ